MAQLLIDDVDDLTLRQLSYRAEQEGKTAQGLIRQIIGSLAAEGREAALKELDAFRATTVGKITTDPVDIVRAHRDRGYEP